MNPVRSILLLFLFLSLGLTAQELVIRYTNDPPVVDGRLDDEIWSSIPAMTDFMQYFPFDTSLANSQTEVFLAYDDENLYFAARMHNLSADRGYVTPSLRRDFRGGAFDAVVLVIDPFKDNTNGFVFGVNPFGVLREGIIANGDDLDNNWDNVWEGNAIQAGEYWTAEMAIPFKTLRFTENQDSWNFNFYRIDSENAERSTWTPIPRNLQMTNLAYTREIFWQSPTGKPGTNISVIPFVAAGANRDYDEGTPRNTNLSAGFDLKYGVTPSLNLDLTVNPDFSQVEVDQQVTNLDRFEIFFPERRQFFLENADLFSSFGFGRTTPFFSRRIGVARDTATGQNVQNSIPFGMRLSGKINDNTRIGFLNMQAGAIPESGVPPVNYSVGVIQQKLFARSNVGFIFVNKHNFNAGEVSGENHNRTMGVDYNLNTANNRWTGKAYYHTSFENTLQDSAYSAGLTLNYQTLNWDISYTGQWIGENYNPEVGFVRRTGIDRSSGNISYRFFPESNIIQSYGPAIDGDAQYDEGGFLDYDLNAIYRIQFKNTSDFSIRWRREFVRLQRPFDPSGSGGEQFEAGSTTIYDMVMINYGSDNRKDLFGNLYARFGGYYGGSRVTINTDLTYRYQPFGFTSLTVNYNRIRLSQPYNSSDLLLIGPRFDFTFSKELFWTTFVQYNTQINNLNINSRLQYRFKPVSDIFLVYTDNYFAQSFNENDEFIFLNLGAPKTRALVFKITYWLNI